MALITQNRKSKRILTSLGLSLVSIIIALMLLVGCGGEATTSPAATAPTTPATTAPATTNPTTTAVAVTTSPVTPTSTASPVPSPAKPNMILATTTSTQDSGLLDVLIPEFQKRTGYIVKTIAVGSGAAMTMGERGEADVLLVHAPTSEVAFMEAGHGIDRRLVMHNDFVIVGPASDPAGIQGLESAIEAMEKIAGSGAIFVSRGDNSGTDQLEKRLWSQSTVDPVGQQWYQETGQGMGATLTVADQKEAYTITDRATYLARQDTLELDILVEGDPVLLNIYHVIQVNPEKSNLINPDGAKAFVEFMVSPDVQEMIRVFGVDKYGQPLFFPDADKTEADLGSV
jgi:tungstate transport system substrate-binding protein